MAFKSSVLLFKVGFGFTWLGISCLGHISKDDRNDSKHKVIVCMLLRRTMEYCDWMAAVTSGHMLFRSPLANELSPLVNVLILIAV